MFGKYKETYNRNNYYIIFFGYPLKIVNDVDIELINVIYF